MFEVHSLDRLWTDIGLIYPLAEHQQRQCQRSLRLHLVILSWLTIENHYGWTVYLGRPYARSTCSIFPLCMESNAWRNLWTKVLPWGFLYELLLWFDRLSKSVMLWTGFSKNHFDSFEEFSQFVLMWLRNRAL